MSPIGQAGRFGEMAAVIEALVRAAGVADFHAKGAGPLGDGLADPTKADHAQSSPAGAGP
jgi:hypothetical protein